MGEFPWYIGKMEGDFINNMICIYNFYPTPTRLSICNFGNFDFNIYFNEMQWFHCVFNKHKILKLSKIFAMPGERFAKKVYIHIILLIKSPSIFPIYHGDSPIYYTYKFRGGFLKFSLIKGRGDVGGASRLSWPSQTILFLIL